MSTQPIFRSNGGAFSVVDSQNSVIKVNGKGVRISGSQNSAILTMQKILQPQFAAGASVGGRNRPLPSTAVASSTSSKVSKAAQKAGVATGVPASVVEQNGSQSAETTEAYNKSLPIQRQIQEELEQLKKDIQKFKETKKQWISFSNQPLQVKGSFFELSARIKLSEDKINKDLDLISEHKKGLAKMVRSRQGELVQAMQFLNEKTFPNILKDNPTLEVSLQDLKKDLSQKTKAAH